MVLALSATNRAEEATLEALHSPLLELDTSDARGALINVVGGPTLTLGEAERCAHIIQEKISPHAKIIWGAAVDEDLGDEIRVMLVLTGVKRNKFMVQVKTDKCAHLGTKALNLSTNLLSF